MAEFYGLEMGMIRSPLMIPGMILQVSSDLDPDPDAKLLSSVWGSECQWDFSGEDVLMDENPEKQKVEVLPIF